MANKDDELVLVVPSDIIFAERPACRQAGKWQGLKIDNLEYYVDLIENNCQFKRRGDVEEDESFQQIIPYMLFSFEDKFFAYKYLANAGEQRLVNNNYQLGVGGHINKEDIKNGGNVLQEGMMREWSEEVDYRGNFLQKKLVGILKDNSGPVEKVHLGLVYHFVGDSDNIQIRETDKMEGKLFDLKDVSENISHSPWMRVVYEEYLKNLVLESVNKSIEFDKEKNMDENVYPGKFFVFEGIDGCGKATQTKLLAEYFIAKGYGVEKIDFPQHGERSSAMVDDYLTGKYGQAGDVKPEVASIFYASDRYDASFKIRKWLAEGKIVVADRYLVSNIGHQGGKILENKWKWKGYVNWLYDLEYNIFGIPKPDCTFILKTSADISLRLVGHITDKDKLETKEKYLSGDKKDIHEQNVSHLENALNSYLMAASEFPKDFKVIECLENGELLAPEVINKKVVEAVENNEAAPEVSVAKETETKKDKFEPIFEGLQMTDQEKDLISPFFTNLDKSVFAISFLPPEIIGALCSRASRAKDDLRQVFLKEFTKPFLEGSDEYSNSLKALIDFLHVHPAEVIFSNPKAREFYITWLAQFGDDSIAQMAGSHLIFSGISQLAIKQIEDMRMGIAPIEKSTRYLDFSTKISGSYRYYTDPTLADFGLEKEYKEAMDGLFDTYVVLMQEYMEFLKKKYPAEEEKVLKTKAFDTLRLILPVSTLGQVALFANGQSFEYMVNRCLDHNLGEIRWTAKSALEELSKIIPAFFRRVESEDAGRYRKYLSGRGKRITETLKQNNWNQEPQQAKEPSVKLLECDLDAENKIIAGLIFREVGEAFESVLGKVRQLSVEEKEAILKSALQGRTAKYYKTPRAFENSYLRFEILMNIGAWRDLHRHRMHTQDRQRFTIYNGFDVPEGLKEAGLEQKFIEAIQKSEEVFKKIELVDKDLAQYCVTMAHRVRFTQYQNLRAFFWETELRTIPQGHPDYRKTEQDKIKLIQKIYPLLSKYLMVDMNDYDFARRGESAAIQRKEEELKKYFETK